MASHLFILEVPTSNINIESEKVQNQRTSPTMQSYRRKKSDVGDASFLADVKDHINEFVYASMDEHITCFQKTIQKLIGRTAWLGVVSLCGLLQEENNGFFYIFYVLCSNWRCFLCCSVSYYCFLSFVEIHLEDIIYEALNET